jgi:hypothetical protein
MLTLAVANGANQNVAIGLMREVESVDTIEPQSNQRVVVPVIEFDSRLGLLMSPTASASPPVA